ncbi:head decoration protein [Pseudomonas aeruginosa]|uniref:head decoration protein n=1 Tax=Pseudomonas aeruginosa TaxID=287 RepID=UPI0020438D67|nr:head decoration protein [Pseudomonas aeruginosa]MCM3889439.1 head decoration protein [Pseudomonas aeruginosa]MCM3940176.1 head decoration protein [Pseudomonas aeruginosa]MCM3951052.1 head decoration protein [Pseudomonas aeruginosa]MCM3958269.1 head decoration protein [Pseudomonas aeruginosa]MCM3964387.1 head decoration protein [Pseudomonas aeruginosa]
MPVITEGKNLGDLLKYEAPNLYSRDQVTVGAGQNLPLGTVVGLVTATAKLKQIDPSATDGSQYAAGVLMQAVDATLIDREDGLMLARHAIVADHALAWPAAITAAEKQAATLQLKSLGILVRKGV